MRKFIKKQILDIFKTLYEAHNSVRTYIEKKKADNAVGVLEECQNTAVQIGDIIDNSEGEGSPVIHLLEEYCETVYQVSVGVSEDITGIKAKKMLDKSLLKAENSVKNDIKVRLEIVFLPYKASMWDSLESVWRAADEDPDCEAYVVPIPYYDRNPDHSFGKYHYEGNDYPEYVPIVYYEKYDLASRRPDVIYIHNPYDANNYVTSVDPKYYSSELKKYTECLVYIPYFVVAHERIQGIILNNSACKYADKVFLQSKPLRDRYISIYEEMHIFDINELRNKFIAMGSPKFDMIVNSKKSDYYIPDEWQKIIGDRKIVLYNTSLTTALNNTFLFLCKLRKTIAYFDDSSEYILWWRPHPLLSSTLSSMRPQYMKEYNGIVLMYRNTKKGIYDDSADLHRAIAFSDIYYGDLKSSVVVLYSASGKPVVSSYIEDENEITSFDQDMAEHYKDNSSLEILKRNEYYDGTSGIHIHKYVKTRNYSE